MKGKEKPSEEEEGEEDVEEVTNGVEEDSDGESESDEEEGGEVQGNETDRKLKQVARILANGKANNNNKSADSVEDVAEADCIFDFLDKSNDKAEARLAARRQARAEAREIRMRELERQQKELEENADRVYDMYTDPISRTTRVAATATVTSPRLNVSNSFQSSRRSSEDSLEETGNIRDVRLELKEVEEKFRKAMIQNAQLDNEKASYTYQVELLKDRLEDLEESHHQLQREHKEKCRQHEQMKRVVVKLKEEAQCYQLQLQERDQLIGDYGLQIVGGEDGESKRSLVTLENAQMLHHIGEGALDVRLRRLNEDRNDLMDQVRHLELELDEERSRRSSKVGAGAGGQPAVNGTSDADEVQRETNKLMADYKFKLQKAEQDVSTLQANVARLESQVVRYKAASESSEKVEDELKVEKRKLQREDSPLCNVEAQTNGEESPEVSSHEKEEQTGKVGTPDRPVGQAESLEGELARTPNKSESSDWLGNSGSPERELSKTNVEDVGVTSETPERNPETPESAERLDNVKNSGENPETYERPDTPEKRFLRPLRQSESTADWLSHFEEKSGNSDAEEEETDPARRNSTMAEERPKGEGSTSPEKDHRNFEGIITPDKRLVDVISSPEKNTNDPETERRSGSFGGERSPSVETKTNGVGGSSGSSERNSESPRRNSETPRRVRRRNPDEQESIEPVPVRVRRRDPITPADRKSESSEASDSSDESSEESS